VAEDANGASGAEMKERLATELRGAMKSRERVRLGALRLLSAAVKNREVELGHTLSGEEFMEMARREVKRRKEAVAAYEAAGRVDRVEQEQEEQRVLEAFLPAGLSEEEVARLVDEAIVATGAKGPGDTGKVMGHVMRRAKGRADGRTVQEMVRRRLVG